LRYSTVYDTRSPGAGFPGCKIFNQVVSIPAKETFDFPKTTDGTKLSTALENSIWAKAVQRE
jgi:hypothetical protein